MNRLLLCTDLDRTVIPNGRQPESEGARRRFAALASRPEVTLVYVSGRHRQLIKQAINDYQLPQPDFVIADVGSTIYQLENRTWNPSQAWRDEIATDWHDVSCKEIHCRLSDFAELRLQEPEKQNRHKLSYYLPVTTNQHQLIRAIDSRLQDAHIKANLIWSIDEPNMVGLLDILPASANKLHAIRFLMQQLEFRDSETLFAGDSGNDLDVLLSSVPSVLVANGDDEVRAAVAAVACQSLYQAHGDFLGMNGNYSAGILEGAAHYHPELLPCIREVRL